MNLAIPKGSFVGIQGPSGSGKSTLFYILGGLLRPTRGQIRIGGTELTALDDDELARLRNTKIGFVFQQFHLLARASVLENILLPARYPCEEAVITSIQRDKALELAKSLGIDSHLEHLPNQLSGGQQQRVAICRALMKDADIIFADEPTGNLDSTSAKQVMELLSELHRKGKTIVLITHDAEVAKYCKIVYRLRDGAFIDDSARVDTQASSTLSGTKLLDLGKGEGLLRGIFQFFKEIVDQPKLYASIARSVFPLAADNLVRNKTKSLLTMLGVVIGVSAVLAMVTLGQFTKTKILESYETLGVNNLSLRGHPNPMLKAKDRLAVNFSYFDWEKDILPLKKIFPEVSRISPLLYSWRNSVSSGGRSISENVRILGVTPDYMEITGRQILAGRAITPYHSEARSSVCVIGYQIAQQVFAQANPLGQILSITVGDRLSYPCLIMGVFAEQKSNKERWRPDYHVVLPYTYFQTVNSYWDNFLDEVSIQIASGYDVEEASKKIRAYFQQKYGKSGQFNVDSDSTLIAQMKRFLNLFAVLLGAIALLSLVVGGIGINNMMLVSIAERVREFGLRKALGATKRAIRVQVLLESLMLCTFAGLIGVLSGFAVYEILIFGATKLIPKLKFEWVVDPAALALSVLSILIVGILSGMAPALKAEKLEIIEALRSE